MNMKHGYFFLFILLTACADSSSRRGTFTQNDQESESAEMLISKPVVNVYVENSGSMDGYVKGITDFEQAVYNYLTDLQISDIADTLQLFYINSQIIPQQANLTDFIENLEPQTFRARGGNRESTDIAQLLQMVLSETNDSTVAIFVSDCIFSPGRGKNAGQYLVNQQIAIKSIFSEKLKQQNLAVIVYQLSSQFAGYYYNRENCAVAINDRRPFYIWLLGNPKYLSQMQTNIPATKFKGSGVQQVFSLTTGNQTVNYAIRLGSGDFKLDKQHPKTHITQAKKSTHHKNAGKFAFSVDADFSSFLLDDAYLKDTAHYRLNDTDFQISLSNSPHHSPYVTALNFASPIIKKSVLSVRLLMQAPEWTTQMNDNEGLDIFAPDAMRKTFGIKYLIDGVFEAYTRKTDYYTDIRISINK
ncbi:MAG: hypothetical protein LBV57_03735 [Candidatus Symbiothrix sp.]|jgi:hypothetical protein|nr:hypothetical protein [Candidatus Symbiothrix sp.]